MRVIFESIFMKSLIPVNMVKYKLMVVKEVKNGRQRNKRNERESV